MSISKSIFSKTAGSGNSISQFLHSNTIVDTNDVVTSPFNFEVPVYTINGATFNFYKQTTDGISASLNNIKSVTFNMSANTNSLTGTTKMKHDIYRIDYANYSAFTLTPILLTATTNATNNTTGNSNSTTTVIDSGVTNTIAQASANILSAITTPFYTTYEDCSGSTFMIGSAHTLNLPQIVKPNGQYSQNLFLDKAQYFIDSTFVFDKSIDQTIGDVMTLSGGQQVQLYNMPYSSTTSLQTSSTVHTITGGTFSGVTVSGASFTYFVPPKKADINVVNDQPSVQGTLNTFAPIFSYKNVEDGDYYKVQVTYNTGDTSFTGDTTTFKFPFQPGNAEYIRTSAVALTPNAQFLYRIGNTKEIINLFQVKQNVTTWSEYVYAETSSNGTFTLSGTTWLNQSGGTRFANAIITLTVLATSSFVDLGSDTTNDPNTTSEVSNPLGGGAGSSTSVVSDSNGIFSFGKINGGAYTITANPNNINYPTQTFNITITSDTNLDIIFSIVWGNTILDFTTPITFL